MAASHTLSRAMHAQVGGCWVCCVSHSIGVVVMPRDGSQPYTVKDYTYANRS
jgi:HD-like signal output (HDOD) protein